MDPKLSITVVSDLHCMHSSKDKSSDNVTLDSTILYSDLLRSDNSLHPVVAMINEIQKNRFSLKTDVLLCPGDITNQVDPQGYISGWSFLEEIRDELNADKLFATIGNHDVDSRRKIKNQLPFDICKSIKKNYPISDDELRQDFWNNSYCIYEDEKYILLIFNSAYTHISKDDAGSSAIQEGILKNMAEKLRDFRKDKIKIALCHHHPLNHSNTSSPDSDVIDKGSEFLDLLHNEKFALVIHGHKHEIKVRYYQSVLVFCSGSFSARQNLRETQSENVFHKIDFLGNNKGLIKTWIFGAINGWVNKSSSVFPAICGFGYNGTIAALASSVEQWFTTKSNSQLDTYKRLIDDIPDVQFLLPNQISELESILIDQYEISFTYDKNGVISQISKVLT